MNELSSTISNAGRGVFEDRESVVTLAVQAKAAARTLAITSPNLRTAAVERIADALESETQGLLEANALDVAAAECTPGFSRAMTDRLRLDPAKIATMAAQLRAVAALDDPIDRVLDTTELADGLTLQRVSCPLGVLLAIVEARPDALTQIAALALKSGNAVLLKPGSEAMHTARAIGALIHGALASDQTPVHAVTLIEGRAAIDILLELDELIDLVIPRGSSTLVRSIMARSRIPVLGHAAGICHIYIDAAAELDMAITIVLDAKTQSPSACNAAETVLIHRDIAPHILSRLISRLTDAGVEVRGCESTLRYCPSGSARAATPEDWGREYGDLIVAVRVVDDIDAAIAHISRHGSRHTEAIVTADPNAAAYFLARVDAAGVFHNVSTRFADGYRYGLGAEIGISTGKLHARGPVGLNGLTTYRYLLHGTGQTVGRHGEAHPA